jgi:hypothetical protein
MPAAAAASRGRAEQTRLTVQAPRRFRRRRPDRVGKHRVHEAAEPAARRRQQVACDGQLVHRRQFVNTREPLSRSRPLARSLHLHRRLRAGLQCAVTPLLPVAIRTQLLLDDVRRHVAGDQVVAAKAEPLLHAKRQTRRVPPDDLPRRVVADLM